MSPIPVKLGIQQRILPTYRAPFFNLLGKNCPDGLSVLAGKPRRDEAVKPCSSLENAVLVEAHNQHILSRQFYFCWQSGLLKWLDSWQPEVLILEANPRYLRTSSAVRWMHNLGRPVIGWGLGAPEPRLMLNWIGKKRSRFLQQFDALLTYSQQGLEEYRHAGFNPQRIIVAPNAVTPRPSQPLQSKPVNPLKPPIILYVGRLQPRKRVDLLLHACAALPDALKPDLWIVGDGPARQGLMKLSEDVYPGANFYGARYGKELDVLFQAADLFVLPGTGGLAVQQAMSFGLPVIVAEADGTQSDLVTPGNGWMVSPGDLSAMINVLQQALQDIPRLRSMGQESYRIVKEEINLENMMHAFERAVQMVLEK
jgi:glycosyltransferase involved in cell wall biosynthesis